MPYGIHMSHRYGFGKASSNPRNMRIATQHTIADRIMNACSRGLFVLLMLRISAKVTTRFGFMLPVIGA